MSDNSDRNLLFGILALQMDFISRDALITAMNAWVLDKGKPLGQILRDQGALAADSQALLEALLDKHLALHGHAPEQSLAALKPTAPVRRELERLADPDLQNSLAHLPPAPPPDDPYLTRDVPTGVYTGAAQRFRILRPHARGGVGQVSIALDEELHREVALKEIQERHADDPQSRSRFLLEAEVTGRLEHPGVVPVYGLGTYADGRPFYAMRFIQGDSLKEAIARFHGAEAARRDRGENTLRLRQLLRRFIDVCNVMAYAHSRGILHRDLKPGNIMLGQYGETLVVDWGLAKVIGQSDGGSPPAVPLIRLAELEDITPTRHGSAIGTPEYMSPEQAQGRLEEMGPASDVYSLGATLYSLLTGKAPFERGDGEEVLKQVARGEFRPPRQVNPQVHPALEAICLKAMALKPPDRYASPRALADDLDNWLADEPVSAWPEPWAVRARRWLSRHRTLVTAGSAAVLVAVVALSGAAILLAAANARETQARELAQRRAREAEASFRLARRAVDRYHTEVSENELLREPGLELLRKTLLALARDAYDQFAKEHGDDPDVRYELANAQARLADITGELDANRGPAITLYQQALATFAQVPAGQQSPAELQRRRAECHDHLGRLYRVTSQYADAEAAYQQALSIWEALLRDDPEEVSYRAGQARGYNGLGNVYVGMKLPDKARQAYQEALKVRQALAQGPAGTPAHQRDWAVSLSNLAVLDQNTGHPDRAVASYRQAEQIQDDLVRAYPNLHRFQADLARTRFNLASLYRRLNDFAQARASYELAVGHWEKLVRRHPAVVDYWTHLVSVYGDLAYVYATDKEHDRVVDAYHQVLKLWEQLAESHLQEPAYQALLAQCHQNFGDCFLRINLPREAADALQKGLVIWKRLTSARPGEAGFRIGLARCYNSLGLLRAVNQATQQAIRLGLLRRANGDPKEAHSYLQEAQRLWRELVNADPARSDLAVGLGATCNNLGDLAQDYGDLDAALTWYDEAIQTLTRPAQEGARQRELRRNLRNAYWGRAEVRARLGRHEDSVQDWTEVLRLEDGPEQTNFRVRYAYAVSCLGKHDQARAEAATPFDRRDDLSGEMLYYLARVYARAAGPGQRGELADRSVRLLGREPTVTFIRSLASFGDLLAADHDLDPLRDRPAFRDLLKRAKER